MIDQLLVAPGMAVRKGQVLAYLNSPQAIALQRDALQASVAAASPAHWRRILSVAPESVNQQASRQAVDARRTARGLGLAALLSRTVACYRIRAQSLANRVVLASNRQTIQLRRPALTNPPPAPKAYPHELAHGGTGRVIARTVALDRTWTGADGHRIRPRRTLLLPAEIQSTLRRFSRRVVKTGN